MQKLLCALNIHHSRILPTQHFQSTVLGITKRTVREFVVVCVGRSKAPTVP